MATDTSKASVHNEDLTTADPKTDSDASKVFELHTGDRDKGTPVDRFRAVRGVNPNTGANAGLITDVAADSVASRLALALRAMPVGSFQAFNGDLRTVEASCKAAQAFVELFHEYGLEFTEVEVVTEDEPNADVETDSGPGAKPGSTVATDSKTTSKS